MPFPGRISHTPLPGLASNPSDGMLTVKTAAWAEAERKTPRSATVTTAPQPIPFPDCCENRLSPCPRELLIKTRPPIKLRFRYAILVWWLTLLATSKRSKRHTCSSRQCFRRIKGRRFTILGKRTIEICSPAKTKARTLTKLRSRG